MFSSTRLSLEGASWIPKAWYPTSDQHETLDRPLAPSTPIPSQTEESSSSAWDPGSRTPRELPSDHSDQNLSIPNAPEHHPGKCLHQYGTVKIAHTICLGEWLLDPRLLNKKLDIHVQGTSSTLHYNGRYENQRGFVVLTQKPKDVKTSVEVRLGFARSRLRFPLWQLYPETTTERPGFIPPEAARPVFSAVGERVVIIGVDLGNDSAFIGNYGVIDHCRISEIVCVRITTQGPYNGRCCYFDISSVCRSFNERVEWKGEIIE